MTAPNFLPEDEEEEPLFVESCLEVTPLKLPFLDNVLVMSMAFVDRNPEKLPGMDVRVEDIDAFARITIVTFLPSELQERFIGADRCQMFFLCFPLLYGLPECITIVTFQILEFRNM